MEGERPDATGYAQDLRQPPLPHQRPAHYHFAPQPTPAQPSRVGVVRIALLAALAVLLVAPPAAIAFETARQDRATTLVGQGAITTGGRGPGRSDGTGPKATPGATKGPAPTTLDGRVRLALTEQGASLLAGDQDGFLSAVDPSVPQLRARLAQRYASLRQLQVKVWDPALVGKVDTAPDGTASATVFVQYCYVVTTCDRMNLQAATRWKVAGKTVTLLDFGTSEDLGPRPWEASELRTAVGDRVVLSTTPKYAGRLQSMLSAAERAATLADRYAKWGPPPSRYVVYLAGPDEWASWYGMKQENWVAGFALPLTADATEIVLNAARVDTKATLDVLRHEFTHVVTLAHVDRAYDNTWWLVEGIAEYVRVKGTGKPFDAMGEVRTFVRSGRWKNTEIAMDDPPEGTSTADVSGRYGIAYLSVQRLADRFGEERMLQFFDLAARQGVALDEAASKAFGIGWDDVAADCVKNIKSRI
ncbi:basic secretory family protein [Dactylosporangium sp. AC04546]|uniref:basic secretory family protein n=1 Tax=Dactylosporangium sp. AC04546 TaxID=2862460 RepID=UPI001EE003E0|nr:basic secretory family protein [Dactylosporangium sp. AC04546]WVK89454.1 basic secretory family protein [Dactylosporangium sp. AC04546]